LCDERVMKNRGEESEAMEETGNRIVTIESVTAHKIGWGNAHIHIISG
jgi:hypothetical protein